MSLIIMAYFIEGGGGDIGKFQCNLDFGTRWWLVSIAPCYFTTREKAPPYSSFLGGWVGLRTI